MSNRNLPKHLRPWSIVDSEELRLLREVAALALQLDRGCDCEYDHRCGKCQRKIDAYHAAKKIEELQQ